MNYKSILLTVLVLVCIGCNSPISTPDSPSETESITANFSFKTKQPLKAVFTNNSFGATSYKWDFGDGSTSKEENPTHRYKSMGVYKVTLTATKGSKSVTHSDNVTVENPTKCYFAGVTYVKLSVNNKYVKFKLIDDDIITTTWFNSPYTLLSTANLPFPYTLPSPKLMDGLKEDDWYKIKLYYSSSNSGSGKELASFKFYTTELDSYPEELVWTNTSYENQIKCQFVWK